MSDAATGYRALGDVADTNIGTLPANTPPNTRFRYIDLSAVEAGFINWGAVTETTFGAAPSRARRIVKNLDVLFGTVRPNLKSHGFIGPDEPGQLIASTGFSVVCGRDGVSHPGYLFHSLMSNHVTAQAVRDAIGSSYPALNDSDVRRLQIFLPPYWEQQGIAQVLDTLDTAIHETEVVIAKLKAVKQGMLHDLLTRGIDTKGKLRPPQAEAPHLYKESPLRWIPKEWEVVKLASLVSSIGQGWSPDCESSPADSGCWGVLKTTAITWDGYNDQENKALPPIFKGRPDLEVRAGDILVTRAGPASRVGVVAYVESSGKRLMISDKMYRLRSLATEVSAYIALALSSRVVQSELGRSLSGMAETQTNISQAIVRELLILRPLFEEQSAIVDRVRASEGRIREEEESLEKLKAFKVGLMDDLLTGQVRVTNISAPLAGKYRTDPHSLLSDLCRALYQADQRAKEEYRREQFGDAFIPELLLTRKDKVRVEIRKENVSHNAPHLHISHSDKFDASISLKDFSILAGDIDRKVLKHFLRHLTPLRAQLMGIWNELNEKDNSVAAEVLINNLNL